MAGVGIAYKIAEALFNLQPSTFNLQDLLDLVALGTVADLAPLMGENRVLVRKGLKQIRETKRQGLFSLAGVAQIKLDKITAGNIGFMLGPRLNASGRLESALASFELLTTKDFMRAGQLAQQLDVQNRQRQTITKSMQTQAEEIALGEDPKAGESLSDRVLISDAYPQRSCKRKSSCLGTRKRMQYSAIRPNSQVQ